MNLLIQERHWPPYRKDESNEAYFYYYSEEISDLINSYYELEGKCKKDLRYLTIEAFSEDKHLMLSYLAAAKLRYYKDGRFTFGNNYWKAQLIRWILFYFDCDCSTLMICKTHPRTVTLDFEYRDYADDRLKSLFEDGN